MVRPVDLLQRYLELWGHAPALELDDEYLQSVQSNLWASSPEREWYMHRRPKVFISTVVGSILLVTAAIVGQPPRSEGEQWWCLVTAAAATIILGYSTFPYWAARRAFTERRRKSAAYRAELSLKNLSSTDNIAFSALFVYNRRQLDAYQEESRNQQRTSFRHAQMASIAGLAILAIGIAVSLGQLPGSDKFVVAGLTGLGAVLSGFIANTFARSARQANEQLNHFYKEPHMVGRVMVAERLVQGMPDDQKANELKLMISSLLAWPLPDYSTGVTDEKTESNQA
jgi:hypothetical protein